MVAQGYCWHPFNDFFWGGRVLRGIQHFLFFSKFILHMCIGTLWSGIYICKSSSGWLANEKWWTVKRALKTKSNRKILSFFLSIVLAWYMMAMAMAVVNTEVTSCPRRCPVTPGGSAGPSAAGSISTNFYSELLSMNADSRCERIFYQNYSRRLTSSVVPLNILPYIETCPLILWALQWNHQVLSSKLYPRCPNFYPS